MPAGGQPLPATLRAFYEARFGADLRGTRIHSGPDAFETARAMNARAFTLGRDIVFGANEYRPYSDAGRHLLAHELAHTIQQSRGRATPATRDADAGSAAHRFLVARPLAPIIQRRPAAAERRERRRSRREQRRARRRERRRQRRTRTFSGEIEIVGEVPGAAAGEEALEKGAPCAAFTFTDSEPARDLAWDDFKPVRPGALDPADAQVSPQLISHDRDRRISAALDSSDTRVERDKKTPELLAHEQIHWRIPGRVVQLANKEIDEGADFPAAFRVAAEVHETLNHYRTGLYDRDTGNGVDKDVIPKFDWPNEWCKVTEDEWEKAVQRRGIRTTTIEPLD